MNRTLQRACLAVALTLAVTRAGAQEPPQQEDVAKRVAQCSQRLESESGALRLAACTILGNLGEAASPAVARLRHVVEADPNVEIRAAAAKALGKIGPKARAAASALLAALRPALKKPYREDHEDLYRYAAFALGKLRVPEAAPLLFKIVVASGEDDDLILLQSKANGALVELGAGALPVLAGALSGGEAAAKSAALFVLSDMKSAASKLSPAIEACCADSAAEVRSAAVFALSSVAGEEAIPKLLKILVEDDEVEVYQAAAEALGRLGDPGTSAILHLLEQGAPEQRLAAAFGLGCVFLELSLEEGTERYATACRLAAKGVGPLRRGLADEDEDVRANCAHAMGLVGMALEGLLTPDPDLDEAKPKASQAKQLRAAQDSVVKALVEHLARDFQGSSSALFRCGPAARRALAEQAKREGKVGKLAAAGLAALDELKRLEDLDAGEDD